MNDRDDATARAAAYAAGALTAEERADFERELALDPQLAEETRGFLTTAAQLGAAVAPVEPTSRLRDAVLGAIGDAPQLPVAAAPTESAESTAEPRPTPGTGGTDAPAGVVTAGPRAWFRRPLAAVAAAAVVVGIAGGATVYAVGQLAPSEAPAPTASERILAQPDARTASSPVVGGGHATLVWSAASGRAAIVLDDLPPLDDDRVYELWFMDDRGAHPAGTFRTTGGSHDLALEGQMRAGAVVGITVEPDGGSPEPTTDPILTIASA
jgi:anti-sigma-K factor RskA